MDYQEFKSRLSKIKTTSSVTGKSYFNCFVRDDKIYYTRESDSQESIDIHELYFVYQHLDFINTTILRDYITGRKFSPSLAILIESGCYDGQGHRVIVPTGSENSPFSDEVQDELTIEEEDTPGSESKAEGLFFGALRNILGPEFVFAKSIGKPVRADHAFLNSDFREMKFPKSVDEKIKSVLKEFDSDFNVPLLSLVHHIDGLILNHPLLGTRIVEFDEEQHFTPARVITFSALENDSYGKMIEIYSAICGHIDYVHNEVFKKHRIKFPKNDHVPHWSELKAFLKDHGNPSNGYIKEKPGFPYLGGRIVQRAYYDLLRDLAHYSEYNQSKLKPVIRIPLMILERINQKNIKQQSTKEIQEAIIEYFSLLAFNIA